MKDSYHIRVLENAPDYLSLELVKSHLKIDHNEEDVLLSGYIASAIARMEGYLSRFVIPREVQIQSSDFKDTIHLIHTPYIKNSVSVSYYNKQGKKQVLTGYDFRKQANGAEILYYKEDEFPKVASRSDAVTITYHAGYLKNDFPKAFEHAGLLLVSDAYEFRIDRPLSHSRSAEVLLRPFKRWV